MNSIVADATNTLLLAHYPALKDRAKVRRRYATHTNVFSCNLVDRKDLAQFRKIDIAS